MVHDWSPGLEPRPPTNANSGISTSTPACRGTGRERRSTSLTLAPSFQFIRVAGALVLVLDRQLARRPGRPAPLVDAAKAPAGLALGDRPQSQRQLDARSVPEQTFQAIIAAGQDHAYAPLLSELRSTAYQPCERTWTLPHLALQGMRSAPRPSNQPPKRRGRHQARTDDQTTADHRCLYKPQT